MHTRKWMLALTVTLTVAALACGAWAQAASPPPRRTAPPPEGIGRPTAPPPDGIRPVGPGPTTSQPAVPLSFSGEYDEMVKLLNLSANQQKFVASVAKDEEKALATYDQEHKKQLEDLNKNLDAFNKRLADPNRFNADANNARTIIQENIARVGALREKLARNFKVRATATFTPEQKTTWIGIKLYRIFVDETTPLGLSAEQSAAVKAICDREAKSATKVDVAGDTELQTTVRQQVIATVLNDEQRVRYAQIVAERQAKTPT